MRRVGRPRRFRSRLDSDTFVNVLSKPATSRSLERTPPAVRVERVVKRFGSTTALAGVDLEVPERMVFGLLGPNR
jgi:hypothetical protein